VASDAEFEEVQKRRMLQLRRRLAEEQRRAEAREQLEVQKQAVLREVLTPEARQRLTNIKMVKPEFADQIELQLIQAAQGGRVKLPITDDQLKLILSRIVPGRREIKIRRM
jgi:programmed cell death protein 5